MIRLLATSAVAAIALTAAVVGFDTVATAGTATAETSAPVRTASMDTQAAPAQADRRAETLSPVNSGCTKTVRVVGVGYGEPVINTCRTAATSQPARP
jgi:nitrous oxide reductase